MNNLMIFFVIQNFLLGFVWTRSNWFNVFIKFTLFATASAGAFHVLQSLGYVVKG
jgi:hypothetical protein